MAARARVCSLPFLITLLGSPLLHLGLVLAESSPLGSYSAVRCNDTKLGTPAYGNKNIVFTVCAEKTIKASVQQVYDVLLDFAEYSKWNTFVVNVTNKDGSPVAPGPAKLGLEVNFKSNGLLPLMNASSSEIVSIADTMVVPENPAGTGQVAINAWTAVMPGIQAQHPNILTDLGDGWTRYVSYESYYGLLAPVVEVLLVANLRRQFEQQGADLKQYVEAGGGKA